MDDLLVDILSLYKKRLRCLDIKVRQTSLIVNRNLRIA